MNILRYYLVSFTLIALLATSAMPADVYWLDRFGKISWNEERARLSSFAHQILSSEEGIGYMFINAGQVSCRIVCC